MVKSSAATSVTASDKKFTPKADSKYQWFPYYGATTHVKEDCVLEDKTGSFTYGNHLSIPKRIVTHTPSPTSRPGICKDLPI